jgi:hypothetical protein
MAQLLNKKVIFLLCFFVSVFFINAQEGNEYQYTKDYKDPQQFEKFRKRRKIIAAWQINQLKDGALVVKLKTNIKQIDAFNNHGEKDKAIEKIIETYIVNKNIMMAYLDNFKFCKIYFIYSNSHDSLQKGVRTGIFLDTNLTIDPNISMTEKFYLIAEKDFSYNSSIGFVKEDSAKFVREKGNPSGGMYDIVIKNKYGHQLKRPFPYLCGFGKKIIGYMGLIPMYYKYEDNKITYFIDKTQLFDRQQSPTKNFKPQPKGFKTLQFNKGDVYEWISFGVEQLNDNLKQFYQGNAKPELDKIDPEIKPFLY